MKVRGLRCPTQRTRVFIRRSMLVRLNLVRPLFCISLVSGPGTETDTGRVRPVTPATHLPSHRGGRPDECTSILTTLRTLFFNSYLLQFLLCSSVLCSMLYSMLHLYLSFNHICPSARDSWAAVTGEFLQWGIKKVSSFLFSFIFLSSPVLSCLDLYCLIVSHSSLSWLVLSCSVINCLTMSCLVPSCHVFTCFVLSFPVLSSNFLSCLVFSCPVIFCLVLSDLILSYPSSFQTSHNLID